MKYVNLKYGLNKNNVNTVIYGGNKYGSKQIYTVTGLSPGTYYKARPYLVAGGNYIYGATLEFSTSKEGGGSVQPWNINDFDYSFTFLIENYQEGTTITQDFFNNIIIYNKNYDLYCNSNIKVSLYHNNTLITEGHLEPYQQNKAKWVPDNSLPTLEDGSYSLVFKAEAVGDQNYSNYLKNYSVDKSICKVNPQKSISLTLKTSSGSNIYVDGRHAIDMGTGVYWSEWNFGAENKWEVGEYVEWANNYPSDDVYLLKYKESGNLITSIAGTEYDIVHTTWGGKWRMPTDQEVLDLIKNSYQDRTEEGYIEIDGEKITGIYVHSLTTESTLFLPASGFKDIGVREGLSNMGNIYFPYTWTGSRTTQNHLIYYRLYMVSDSTRIEGDQYDKNLRLPIRPVWDPNMPGPEEISVKPEYVDLGLSVKWAKWNIGASSTRDKGQYFSWGQTSGYYYKQKEKSEINSIDYDIYGNSRYDIATALWGDHWRLPTEEEWDELRTAYNSVSGTPKMETKNENGFYTRVATFQNGNSIEFPTMGYKDFTNENIQYDALEEGFPPADITDGFYWSGDYDEKDTQAAHYQWISGPNLIKNTGTSSKKHRLLIRAVYDEGKVPENVNVPSAEASKAVDLGLWSGNLWATYNVGAKKETESGVYVAWGELQEKISQGYRKENYAYLNPNDTKHSGFSLILGNDIQKTNYDIAHVSWKGDWQMPTDADFRELRDNCKWVEETRDGVLGYKIIGPNENSIFLPCSGYYNDKNFIGNNTEGNYWCSTMWLFANEYQMGYTMNFSNENGYDVSRYSRKAGLTVRPVQHPNLNNMARLTLRSSHVKLKFKDKEIINSTITTFVKLYSEQVIEIEPLPGYEVCYLKVWNGSGMVHELSERTIRLTINSTTINYDITVLAEPTGNVITSPGNSVDMNSDSIVWSDRNLGAESELDSGYYIQWGVLTPKSDNDYSRTEYEYFQDNKWLNIADYTTNKSVQGFYDFNVYNYDKDAARFYWGDGWRLPTQAEVADLWLNDDNTWTWITKTADGRSVKGMEVTNSKTGNSIFFPACGRKSGNSGVINNPNYGLYWTSSLDTHHKPTAPIVGYDYGLNLSISQETDKNNVAEIIMPGTYRNFGLCIRPVRDKKYSAPASLVTNNITTQMLNCSDDYVSSFTNQATFEVTYKSDKEVSDYGILWNPSSSGQTPTVDNSGANKITRSVGIEGKVKKWIFPTKDYWEKGSSSQDPTVIVDVPELQIKISGIDSDGTLFLNDIPNKLKQSTTFSMLAHIYQKNAGSIINNSISSVSNIDDYAYLLYNSQNYNNWTGDQQSGDILKYSFSTSNKPEATINIDIERNIDYKQNTLLRGYMCSKAIRIPSSGTNGSITISRYPYTFNSPLYLQDSAIIPITIGSGNATPGSITTTYSSAGINCFISDTSNKLQATFTYQINSNTSSDYKEYAFILGPKTSDNDIQDGVYIHFIQEPNADRIYYGNGFINMSSTQDNIYANFADEYENPLTNKVKFKFHSFFETCSSKVISDTVTLNCPANSYLAYPDNIIIKGNSSNWNNIVQTQDRPYKWGSKNFTIIKFIKDENITIQKV